MTWGETWRLLGVLAEDPSSHTAAAIAGWAHPVTHEYLALADLFDAFVRANSRKGRHPRPYPRPWDASRRKRFGRATRPQAEIRAALAARGH